MREYSSKPTVDRPFIGLSFPADEDAAHKVLEMVVGDDGRSDFRWLRLANGDLMLGVWPTGEGYFEMETAVEADYEAAVRDNTDSVCWMERVGIVTVGPGITPHVGDVRFDQDEPLEARV